MKTKLFVGLAILAICALFPLSSLSKADGNTDSVVLTNNNVIILGSEVNDQSVSEVITKAKELDKSLSGMKETLRGKKPIYLFLNTPGGNIQAGLEMIEMLNGLGRPVHTVTLFAASMGFQIVQNLGDRLILKNGVLMSHHAAGQFSGYFGGQSPSQLDSRTKIWLDRIREMDEQTVKRTNGKQTYESYTKEYDHELWLTGTDSVKQGYADKIVTVKCDSSLTGVTTKHISFMGADIAYDLDNCPLNTAPMNVRISMPEGKSAPTVDASDIKSKFLTQYENKQRQVIPMYW